MPKSIPKRAMLIILDGWGLGTDPEVDAIAQANTPTFDRLMQTAPNARLVTYGEEVGLPEGQMGNSEVGHLNIGAGRIVYQDFARINKAIREQTFANEPALQACFAFAKTRHDTTNQPRALHLMGLLSDGGVHSHIEHLLALSDAATAAGVEHIYVHAFTDGRDTAPQGGAAYLETLLAHTADQPTQLATITGRYYAMDRDRRWERIQQAYDALVHAKGERTNHPVELLRQRYAAGQTDEFIEPIICTDETGLPVASIEDGDAVIFFNFRTDRPRQLTEVLTQQAHPEYGMQPLDLHYVTMTRYDESFQGLQVVYSKDDLSGTLGEVLAKAGKTQLRIAETEKYPHVTFFFNGGREQPFAGEDRIIVPSPKVATYDLQPEMSAHELRDKLLAHLHEHHPDFVCVNFANTDMVGHTGDMQAACKAAEVVDRCLTSILEAAGQLGYDSLIIADHGNSDIMRNPDGSPHTAHTTNLVPVILVPAGSFDTEADAPAVPPTGSVEVTPTLRDGKLGDVAPTLLALLNLAQPVEMDGKSLLQ